MSNVLDMQKLPEAAARLAAGGSCISVLSVVFDESVQAADGLEKISSPAASETAPASALVAGVAAAGVDTLAAGSCISVLSVVFEAVQ